VRASRRQYAAASPRVGGCAGRAPLPSLAISSATEGCDIAKRPAR
jgi:hypothetical protein